MIKIRIIGFVILFLNFKACAQKWIINAEKGITLSNDITTNNTNYLKSNNWEKGKFSLGINVMREIKNNLYIGLGTKFYKLHTLVKPKYSAQIDEKSFHQNFFMTELDISKKIISRSKFTFIPSVGYQFGIDTFPVEKELPFAYSILFLGEPTSKINLSCIVNYPLSKGLSIGAKIGYNISLEPIYIKSIDNITAHFFYSNITLSKGINGKIKREKSKINLN